MARREFRDFGFKRSQTYSTYAPRTLQESTPKIWHFPHYYSSHRSSPVSPWNTVQFNYSMATRGGISHPNLQVLCWKDVLRKSFANPAQLQLIKPLFSLNTSPPMRQELCTICSGFLWWPQVSPPPSQPPSLYPSIKPFIRFAFPSLWGAVRPSLEVRKPFIVHAEKGIK